MKIRLPSAFETFLRSLVPPEEFSDPLLDLPNTAERVERMWKEELLYGYSDEGRKKLEHKFRAFPRVAEGDDASMVTEAGIPFTSTCAHHLLPFRGVAHFGYIPHRSVLGLSKVAWVLDYFAARLQLQESLTDQVIDYLYDRLSPVGMILVLEAEHMCMACRGPRKAGVLTSTSALRGIAVTHPEVRTEFYRLMESAGRRDR